VDIFGSEFWGSDKQASFIKSAEDPKREQLLLSNVSTRREE